MSSKIVNAFTVDVEDYFHVSAFSNQIHFRDWDHYESRVVGNTFRVLELLSHFDVKATFFVLGWVADKYPSIVREIQAAGHEIGSHSFRHEIIYKMTPDEFREDTVLSCKVLEEITGEQTRSYRAPSFSITQQSTWALDVLINEGFQIDSSIYPVQHDVYGMPDADVEPHQIKRPHGTIWECPGTVRSVWGKNIAVGGGGYFRIFPSWWTFSALNHINQNERRPFNFYIHPWELDPEQPRLDGGLKSKLRHYTNLRQTERRLRRLLTDFKFGPLSSLVPKEVDVPKVQPIPV